MSNNFYEGTLLRQEFILVAKLQQDAEFSKYASVSYEDRNTRSGEVQSVDVQPSGPRYPEKYIVDYHMPVYVEPGQLRRDWHGTVTMLLSESVLMKEHSNQAPHVTFHSDFTPFNNHVRRDMICVGNAWAVARKNGLWHFIISLGALINQDEFVSAEGSHYSDEAYRYWVTRDRKPVTNINWPLDLLSQPDIVVVQSNNRSPLIEITPRIPEPPASGISITKVRDRLAIKQKPAPSSPALIVITPKKG